jgi:hypothetical protein
LAQTDEVDDPARMLTEASSEAQQVECSELKGEIADVIQKELASAEISSKCKPELQSSVTLTCYVLKVA